MTKIAVLPCDGAGKEVVPEAIKVLRAAGADFEFEEFEVNAEAYLRTGVAIPNQVWPQLEAADSILFGAVGDPRVPDPAYLSGVLLRLRFELDLYVNLRPFQGADLEFLVVREGTEGTYAGEGGFLRKGTPHEVATQGSVNTRMGSERCVRFAFELAGRRNNRLTLVHKTNVLTFAGDLWSRTVKEVAADYPDVSWDYNHVDAACIYLVEQPKRYDVIVTDNLFGDILTDLAGAVAGGIGFAASANLNPARTGPSLFEPVHGAAHDIAGQGIANPLAAIHSAALMLEHLGEADAAARMLKALSAQADSMSTSAEQLSTSAVGDAIAERL